jgi:hypothetical protein
MSTRVIPGIGRPPSRGIYCPTSEVVGVYADPAILPCPTYCDDGPVGTHKDVAKILGVAALRKAGLRGKGVRIAIVDTGINGEKIKVSSGWSVDGKYVPGSAALDHGTMCAFDALIAAPSATILDYALLRNDGGGTLDSFLSDALAAFADLVDILASKPGPLVVNNSWAIFDRSDDAPIGSPEKRPRQGTAAQETRWSLEHVAAILQAAGSSLERVVQVTLLISDPADYHEINAEYVRHFPRGLPARHTARFGVPTTARLAVACIALAAVTPAAG